MSLHQTISKCNGSPWLTKSNWSKTYVFPNLYHNLNPNINPFLKHTLITNPNPNSQKTLRTLLTTIASNPCISSTTPITHWSSDKRSKSKVQFVKRRKRTLSWHHTRTASSKPPETPNEPAIRSEKITRTYPLTVKPSAHIPTPRLTPKASRTFLPGKSPSAKTIWAWKSSITTTMRTTINITWTTKRIKITKKIAKTEKQSWQNGHKSRFSFILLMRLRSWMLRLLKIWRGLWWVWNRAELRFIYFFWVFILSIIEEFA